MARNRGKQSSDDRHFAPKWLPIFKAAADDMGFLLSRGYAPNATLQLVGNHYRLNKRQRSAIFRASASAQEIQQRQQTEIKVNNLNGTTVDIDGFNLLILMESALSGGFIFKGRDSTYRDLSSVHGSYKRVMQTENAIHLIGEGLDKLGVSQVNWYLDQPVSNSGRLKSKLLEVSQEKNYNWEVALVNSPDKVLAVSENVVVSSDGWILNQVKQWVNLGVYLVDNFVKKAELIVI